VLATFTPSEGARQKYTQTGAEETELKGYTISGTPEALRGLVFTNGGTEHFEVTLPKGAGLVLRKRFLLDDKGQTADVVAAGVKVPDFAGESVPCGFIRLSESGSSCLRW